MIGIPDTSGTVLSFLYPSKMGHGVLLDSVRLLAAHGRDAVIPVFIQMQSSSGMVAWAGAAGVYAWF